MCYGLIGPGWEMAELLAYNMTQGKIAPNAPKTMVDPDMSTKLKLLGIQVASFGDSFADVFGPKWLPEGTKTTGNHGDVVKSLTFKDPFSQVYKKYLFTADGKYLLGGMMMGDTADYVKLLPMSKGHKPLTVLPSELMVGKPGGGADDPNDLYGCNALPLLTISLTLLDPMRLKSVLAIMSPRAT
jgi:nitrite reductase (NAD(P)H)